MDDVITAALPSRWKPDRSRGRYIILCGETINYRAIARNLTAPEDVVLELGCSFGDATAELAMRASVVRAVDHSTECVERTAARLPDIETHQLDVFGNSAQLLSLGAGCSSVFCDLNGNRALSSEYISLLALIQERLRPNLLVVKCRAMHGAGLRSIGSGDEGGVVPIASARFWSDLLESASQTCDVPAPSAEDDEEIDPSRVPSGEERLCYTFLNRGRCERGGCTFRHLRPGHPDAVADTERRAAVGWQPSRVRGRGRAAAEPQPTTL